MLFRIFYVMEILKVFYLVMNIFKKIKYKLKKIFRLFIYIILEL